MTRLATQAEVLKLARTLGVPAEQLDFLRPLPDEALRHFRAAVSDFLYDEQRPLLRWLAHAARWLPAVVSAVLVRYWLKAPLTARLAAELPAWRVAAIARFLPADFLADIATTLDPRGARELVQLLPVSTLIAITHQLLARSDHLTLGRFVGYLPDARISDIAASIVDEGDLLDIVFFIESPNRLDHLLQVLPAERIERALALVSQPEQRARWPSVLALLSYVGYGLKRELGEQVVGLGEAVLTRIIEAADEGALWEDLVPVVASLSPAAQARIVALPAIREPALLQRILQAIDACAQWPAMLSLVAHMDTATRDGLAQALATLPKEMLERVAYAALLRSQWDSVFDIVARLPAARQRDVVEILGQYLPDLDQRTADTLRAFAGTTIGAA